MHTKDWLREYGRVYISTNPKDILVTSMVYSPASSNTSLDMSRLKRGVRKTTIEFIIIAVICAVCGECNNDA
eukprot:scaffold1942_cov197-Alexandrium_tamarense.AAC.18